jgi:large subunit ribosomal protein L36e
MSGTARFAGTTGHPVGETKTNLAVGMDHGKVVTKIALPQKPSYRKGKLNKRVSLVREVIREVAGFSPYEKRVMELLKVGKEKRALKLLKTKLGEPTARTRPPHDGVRLCVAPTVTSRATKVLECRGLCPWELPSLLRVAQPGCGILAGLQCSYCLVLATWPGCDWNLGSFVATLSVHAG